MDVQVVNLLPHRCTRRTELQERSQTMFTLLSQDMLLLRKREHPNIPSFKEKEFSI